MNILGWSGQNHNTVIIHEAPKNFNAYFVHFAFLDTYDGHLYIYDNIEALKLVCIHKHNCPQKRSRHTNEPKPPLFGVSQMEEVARWIRAKPGAAGSEGAFSPPQSANAASSPIPYGTGEP